MGDELSIVSMNVRGLGDAKKRRDVFNWLRKQDCSIICLQDTHTVDRLERIWETEWGYKAMFCSFRGDSRGTAILFCNNFEFRLHKVKKDPGGNYIALDMEALNMRFTLINIYGPNRDSPDFYREISETTLDFGNSSVIMCGDWNLVQNYELDCYGYLHRNNPQARQQVLNIKQDFELLDPWRQNNEDKRSYTWRSSIGGIKQARLDFFLISADFYSQLLKSAIKPGYRTDHSVCFLKLGHKKQARGRGFWKLNTSLLRDTEYVRLVKEGITATLQQYAIPGENIDDKAVKLTIDDQLFWEMLKIEIRGITIPYSSRKKAKNEEEEKLLNIQIANQEREIDQNPSEQLNKELGELKEKLEKLREPKIRAIMLRSKVRWVEHGEKPTKYFCSLEKRNFTSRTISLVDTGKEIKTEPTAILTEIKAFYQTLYSRKLDKIEEHEGFFLDGHNIPQISAEDRELCEAPITETEIQTALKHMKNNKSPGSDGFPCEFYKFFWKDLGHFMYRSFQQSFRDGQLSITQRQGVITCLPKGEKPRQFLKNWRPITLLNTDYKIISSVIANRLKTVLPHVISSTQKGFLKGRYIGENTRLVYDIIQYLENTDQRGLLLLVDFEKAFDSLEWEYIDRMIKAFNFGKNLLGWVKTFYKNASSCVINNGHFSEFFNLEKGCRQGDPLSPYLFIMAIEPLAVRIKNSNINGIKVGTVEHVIGQYADDTFILMDGTEQSFRATMGIFERFRCCSGLKMNVDKTKAVWLGAGARDRSPICSDLNVQWSRGFELLGIKFIVDNMKDCVAANLKDILVKITRLLNSYKKRNLTLVGKVTVIKTLAVSKLIHVFSVLPSPNNSVVKKMNEMFTEFIWNSKTGKVNRNLLAQDKLTGGLKLTHIATLIEALKIKWVKDILEQKEGWADIFKHCAGSQYNDGMWQLDEKSLIILKKKVSNFNPFWADMIGAWAKLVKAFNNPEDVINYSFENAWYITNKNLKRLQPTLNRKGIHLIRDLLDEQGAPLQYRDFKLKYDLNINFIDYMSLIKSVPKEWCHLIRNTANLQRGGSRELPVITNLKKTDKTCRWAYKELVMTLKVKQPYKEKWAERLNDIGEDEWLYIHSMPFKCTKNTKLQSFQYKVVHNILATQKTLLQYKLSTSDLCTFCEEATETIQHLLFSCPYTRQCWSDLETWLRPILEITDLVMEKHILLGSFQECIVDLIFIVSKYSIYISKLKGERPKLDSIKRALKQEYTVEREIAKRDARQQEKFNTRWGNLPALLEN